MQTAPTIWQPLHEEAGLATYLTGLFMGIGLLLTISIFLAVLLLNGSRALAQNGSDAAALAAAGVYADALSNAHLAAVEGWSWRLIGACYEPLVTAELRAIQNYRSHYQQQVMALQGVARSEAARFAQANFARLDQGRFQAAIRFVSPTLQRFVQGVLFNPTRIKIRSTHRFATQSGQQHNAPAYADAAAYLTEATAVVRMIVHHPECGKYGGPRPHVQYRYRWQVTLVDDRR